MHIGFALACPSTKNQNPMSIIWPSLICPLIAVGGEGGYALNVCACFVLSYWSQRSLVCFDSHPTYHFCVKSSLDLWWSSSRLVVTWCFAPSQPLRLYQGEHRPDKAVLVDWELKITSYYCEDGGVCGRLTVMTSPNRYSLLAPSSVLNSGSLIKRSTGGPNSWP